MHLCIKGQITLSDVIFLRAMAVQDDSTSPPWVMCEAVWKDTD